MSMLMFLLCRDVIKDFNFSYLLFRLCILILRNRGLVLLLNLVVKEE